MKPKKKVVGGNESATKWIWKANCLYLYVSKSLALFISE